MVLGIEVVTFHLLGSSYFTIPCGSFLPTLYKKFFIKILNYSNLKAPSLSYCDHYWYICLTVDSRTCPNPAILVLGLCPEKVIGGLVWRNITLEAQVQFCHRASLSKYDAGRGVILPCLWDSVFWVWIYTRHTGSIGKQKWPCHVASDVPDHDGMYHPVPIACWMFLRQGSLNNSHFITFHCSIGLFWAQWEGSCLWLIMQLQSDDSWSWGHLKWEGVRCANDFFILVPTSWCWLLNRSKVEATNQGLDFLP